MANPMEGKRNAESKVDPVEVQGIVAELKRMYPASEHPGVTEQDYGIAAKVILMEFGPSASKDDMKGVLEERMAVGKTPSLSGKARVDGTIVTGPEAAGAINQDVDNLNKYD